MSPMGLFDKLRERLAPSAPAQGHGARAAAPAGRPGGAAKDPDEAAVERYRYMLRTAPPETIEQAHAEAFAKLTPEQRQRVLHELTREIPEAERPAAARAANDPYQLARVATRAEIRQPGVMERVFGGMGAAPASAGLGMGGLLAGGFLGSMAGTVLGSMIAQHFFDTHPEASHLFGDSTHHADAGHLAGEHGAAESADAF